MNTGRYYNETVKRKLRGDKAYDCSMMIVEERVVVCCCRAGTVRDVSLQAPRRPTSPNGRKWQICPMVPSFRFAFLNSLKFIVNINSQIKRYVKVR